MRRGHLVAALIAVLGGPTATFPCTRSSPVSLDDLVRDADLIVRATAVDYAQPPANPAGWTSGEPDSVVRFDVTEVLRGSAAFAQLTLPGYLSERDDFNDQAVPYTFVRPNGRGGSCFANTYRSGAQFLLFLKQRNGRLTVNWYALGPVNEQLRSENDPWLRWVRQRIRQ
jgi:hypothetical protein